MVAGIVLTGGGSTRMGVDKATLSLEGETLARRTGRLLAGVADPCVEVGPGYSGLPPVTESPPGAGPLAALVQGWNALAPAKPDAVLVVATDLPALTDETLSWLAAYPGSASVIPLVEGYAQPLCARWSAQDLERARVLARQGRRALRDLVAACDVRLANPDGPDGPGVAPFVDADTPDTARALGLSFPGPTATDNVTHP